MNPPIFLSIAGWSGSGKTTLMEKLLPLLRQHGLSVAVAKHSGKDLDTDHSGKDSHRYRLAGADPAILVGPHLVTAWKELTSKTKWQDVVRNLSSTKDLVLCEGFKSEPLPRIEVLGEKKLLALDGCTLARVKPYDLKEMTSCPIDDNLPLFAREDLTGICLFIKNWLREELRK